jgi:hypothetical protein
VNLGWSTEDIEIDIPGGHKTARRRRTHQRSSTSERPSGLKDEKIYAVNLRHPTDPRYQRIAEENPPGFFDIRKATRP